jgi:hypothetical protein
VSVEVERHAVGVRDARQRLRLADQPLAPRARFLAQELERDRSIELGVARAVHDAHAAGAEQTLHDEAADARADDHRAGRRGSVAAGSRGQGQELAAHAAPHGVRLDPASLLGWQEAVHVQLYVLCRRAVHARGAAPRRAQGIRI